jgi:hypothetical protein
MGSPHEGVPEWTRAWSVDECIECLPLGEDVDRVTGALLEAMPDAYDGDNNHDEDGEAIIEDRTGYRTGETFAKRSLAAIWADLDAGMRDALGRAHLRYELGLA